MVHAHSDLILQSRVLTTDQWADYLIYINPAQKVFIDGRSDFYGPEVGNDYLRLIERRLGLAAIDGQIPLQPGPAAGRIRR